MESFDVIVEKLFSALETVTVEDVGTREYARILTACKNYREHRRQDSREFREAQVQIWRLF